MRQLITEPIPDELSLIVDKTPNAIAIFNEHEEVLWVNQGFKKMYGLALSDFIESTEATFFQQMRPHIETINNKDSAPDSVSYEKKWEVSPHKSLWILGTLFPIQEKNGKALRYVTIEREITDFKLGEAQMEEQYKDLVKATRSLETTNEILENQRIVLEQEQKKVDDLLLNILPHPVAKQLKTKGYSKLKSYKMVSVMFTDFQGFTSLAEKLTIQDLIQQLSYYFDHFDEITSMHHIEKIKTIGDSYMCAGGLPLSNKSNPIDMVLASLEIQEFASLKMAEQNMNNQPLWQLRLGIHTGEIIAGVIGKRKFAYDIWGDTVNTASRMETAGDIGKVNISGVTYEYIKEYFDCTYRGKIEVKHKGELDMYFVNRLKPEYAEDEKGITPNEKFRRILASY